MRRFICTLSASVALLSSLATAQTSFDYAVDQPQSNFTWSGTTSIGNIVGNPSNAFQLAGTAAFLQSSGGGLAVATTQFNGGDVRTVPDLHGKIPNLFPFLPPLALIDITNLHLRADSPAVAVAPGGAFSASVTFTALSGTLTITLIGQSPTANDLTGQASSPTSINGTITANGNNLALTEPINIHFMFSDPGSGANGTVDLVGTLKANWTCPAPVTYCAAKVNSLGCTPSIASSGAAKFGTTSGFVVSASSVLNNKSGLLFYGVSGAQSLPFQGGTLCVQAPIKRTPSVNSGGNPPPNDCSGLFSIDMNAFATGNLGGTPLAALQEPGTGVVCQWWGRDPGFTAPDNTTLSNALSYVVAP